MGLRQMLKAAWIQRTTTDLSSCELHIFEKLESLITPASAESNGMTPAIPIKTLKSFYLSDSMAFSTVESLAEQVCGMGFYTSAQPITNSKGLLAKEVLDQFCDDVGLDMWALEATKNLIWAGFAMTKPIPSMTKIKELPLVPPESITRIYRKSLTNETIGFDQMLSGSSAKIDPKSVIFMSRGSDAMEPFGISLLRPLAMPRTLSYTKEGVTVKTETIPPAFAMKAMMELDISKAFHRYGTPRNIFVYPGADDTALQTEADKVKNMDEDYATNSAGFDVKTLSPRVDRGWECMINFQENRLYEALQNPELRLVTSTGFTEASAREATRLAAYKVYGMERMLKRGIERFFFAPVLENAGIDPIEAKPRLFWGPVDRPQLEPNTVLLAYQGNPNNPNLEPLITRDEARKILAKLGWELEISPQPSAAGIAGVKSK